MRLVYLGSPPFATPVLERLLASPFRPELVVTPPDRPRGRGRKSSVSAVAELARAADVPVLQPETVRGPEFLDELRAVDADLFLVVSYGELLRQEFIELPRKTCLNVHPSLLPRHRGATPIQAAILAGDEVTGTSIQEVVLELDAGDLLVQKELAVHPGETAGELAGRLAVLSGEALIEALTLFEEERAVFTPQDPERVTVCKRLKKEHGAIDWARDAVELERHVRAMNPWPGAQTSLSGGQGLAIWRASALPLRPEAGDQPPPGKVLLARGRWIVACGSGALELLEVQAAGKRTLSGEEFLRGARLAEGDLMGEA